MKIEEKNGIRKYDEDVSANCYTLKCLRYAIIMLLIIWILNIIGFFKIQSGLMNVTMGGSLILLLVPFVVNYFMDDDNRWVKYYYLGTVCVMVAVINTALSFHVVLTYVMPMLFAVQYSEKKVLWITYIMDVVVMFFSTLGGYYFGICDLNLLFESTNTRMWYFDDAVNIVDKLVLIDNHLYVIVVFVVLPRAMILFVYVNILKSITERTRYEAVRAERMRLVSEIDLATQVYNKGKYESMAEDYYPDIFELAVVFWDMNNLKMINDKYGHKAGDEAIIYLASCINSVSNERIKAFRYGGDEFLLIIEEPGEGECEKLINYVNAMINSYKENHDYELSAAYGCAIGAGADIRIIVSRADGNMYNNKKETNHGRK